MEAYTVYVVKGWVVSAAGGRNMVVPVSEHEFVTAEGACCDVQNRSNLGQYCTMETREKPYATN